MITVRVRALLILLALVFVVGCTSVPYYVPTNSNPAIIKLAGKSALGDGTWKEKFHLSPTDKIPLTIFQVVDGSPLNPNMGFSAVGPWKIDGGKHSIKLMINDTNGVFIGAFNFQFESGHTYVLMAVRNPEVATDRAGFAVALLTEIRKRGGLEERKESDPRKYDYRIKLFDENVDKTAEVLSIEAIIVETSVR